jgi:hypothetical protein
VELTSFLCQFALCQDFPQLKHCDSEEF